MRRMISVGRQWPCAASPVDVRRRARRRGGTGSRRGPSTRPPGRGSFWPRGQHSCEPAIPTGTIGAPVRRARTATPSRACLERAVAAARALREHEQHVALVEDPLGQPEGLDVGACRGRPGGRRRCAAIQPTTGQSNSSFLPSHWNRRPSFGHERTSRAPTASRFEAWLAATMTGPSRGISSIAPSTRTRVRPRATDPDRRRPARAIQRRDRARRSAPSAARRRVGLGHRAARRRRVARLGVADRPDDRRDGLLERVAVGRDDPGVGGDRGAAPPPGSRRVDRGAGAPRGSPRPPAPSGSRPRSSARRRARSSTEASRYSLRSASGSTTVPMSRPAMTIPPSAARSRWRCEQGRADLGHGRDRRDGRVDRRRRGRRPV